MEIQIAVAKTNKYAVSESGDTLEVVERPNGGVSVVLADGQTSGRGAKAISTMVVRKVISLLAEGVRDGAAARAASDYLYTERYGKVSATLNILSADLQYRHAGHHPQQPCAGIHRTRRASRMPQRRQLRHWHLAQHPPGDHPRSPWKVDLDHHVSPMESCMPVTATGKTWTFAPCSKSLLEEQEPVFARNC